MHRPWETVSAWEVTATVTEALSCALRTRPLLGWALLSCACLAAAALCASAALVLRRRPGSVRTVAIVAGGVLAVTSGADWVLLRALPLLRISFSEQIVVPLVASLSIRLALFLGLGATLALAERRARTRGVPFSVRSLLALYLFVQLSFSTVQVYAYTVEPLWIETSVIAVQLDGLDPDAPPLRVVHIGDLHVERASYREARIVDEIQALAPDVIVLSGDYLNLSRLDDATSVAHFSSLASRLHAPYGVYAVRGTVEYSPASMARLVEGTPVTWLEQQAVTLDVRGQRLALVGVACSHQRDLDTQRLDDALAQAPADVPTLLLYHSPDLIAEAAARGVDLYLAGHTHGGQLCLPFYGALATGSVYGKRYEAGHYRVGDTMLYVTRGLGLEGGSMPRARFLARPEIVLLELSGPR